MRWLYVSGGRCGGGKYGGGLWKGVSVSGSCGEGHTLDSLFWSSWGPISEGLSPSLRMSIDAVHFAIQTHNDGKRLCNRHDLYLVSYLVHGK